MKKLILIENDDKYQFDSLEELVKCLIDEKFYEMSEIEKKNKMELKAFSNILMDNIKIIDKDFNINDIFILKDEITYIFSLLILNKVMILESTDSNIFTKNLDKSNISDNYIIVNKFAKELLGKYLEK